MPIHQISKKILKIYFKNVIFDFNYKYYEQYSFSWYTSARNYDSQKILKENLIL
jgi:hypothetical protein